MAERVEVGGPHAAPGAATTAAALAWLVRGDESTPLRDVWLRGADGVRLHAVEAGAGPPVVLLHGFPDFWFGWRHQLRPLAAAGLRAIAPDLRGYNLSDAPRGLDAYRVAALADDVAQLVRAAGVARAHVVGHDWGGVVAWHVAARHPDVVDRLAILNAPHPARFRALLRTSTQALRSWYVGAFQLPWLPERALAARGGALLRAMLVAGHAHPGALTDPELAAYAAAFPSPDALRAPLAYYRAAVRRAPADALRTAAVAHRTLVVWGGRDPALVRANAEGLAPWVPDVRTLHVPDAGHWVMVDAAAAVNDALVRFLREP